MWKFIILILIPTYLWAAPIHEIQEVRLAKAELALVDGNKKEAFKLLNKNMDSKHFHLDTYLFLARYHYEDKKYSKSFRVLHYIVKKMHPQGGKKIIFYKDADSIESLLKSIPRPNEQALQAYDRMAYQYFDLYQQELFTNDLNASFLENAAKYYRLCVHYDYNKLQSHISLGQVENKRENFQESINNLVVAKELSENKKEVDQREQEDIKLLLADSLIQEGHTDAGTVYLKSLYLSTKSDQGLKDYARDYVDSLSQSFFSTTLSLNLNYNSNVNRLSNVDLETFDDNQSFYVSKDGYSTTRALNSFYSSDKHYKYWSYIFNFDYSEEKLTRRTLSRLDSRTYSAGTELKYDNLIKSIVKLGYTYTQTLIRDDNFFKYRKYSTANELYLSYIHTLKRGTLTYKSPMTFTNTNDGENTIGTIDLGLSINYVPFWKGGYFAPSYSIEWLRDHEEEDESTSNNLVFTISNHTIFSSERSLFLYGSFTIKSNATDTIAYNEASINAYINQLAPFLKNLSFNFSTTYSITNYGDGSTLNVLQGSVGSSYSF